MILTFSEDKFIDRINSGIKIHTIREDKYNRWKPGMKIHFWRGNPRNITKNPYQFGIGIVSVVNQIVLNFDSNYIYHHGRYKLIKTLNEYAVNDGFNSWDEMKDWFKCDLFTGKLIIWKNYIKLNL